MIQKKNINKVFYLFIFSHLLLWTLIPSLSNVNLPLDTIEALAWGSNLDWGYDKHPPFSAFIINLIYIIFKTNDWAYYLLSQLCVIIGLYFVWELSKEFFSNRIFSFLSVVVLETIVFFNYTTPEFNVYVCQLPLKAALIYFFWKGLNNTKSTNWILIGILSALGVLTHYSFIFIILSLFICFVIIVKKNKKTIKNFFISFVIFLIILSPHIFWLFDNNFEAIKYALNRSNVENKDLFDHILNPVFFISKQLGMLMLFFITFLSILSFKKLKKIKLNLNNKKEVFLLSISLLPILIVFIVSFVTGAKIRTMWLSTFYLFFGILFFYFLKNFINLKKTKNFIYVVSFLFLLSPLTYFYVSLSNDTKRTDFPGKEIANLVQTKWDNNFINEIKIVVGDEWSAGNLSYHLYSRPTWINDLQNRTSNITDDQGVIYTGNPKILKKICPGVFGTIRPYGYCMIGKR